MHLSVIISSKYTVILLRQISGISLKFKVSTLKAIRSEETAITVPESYFRTT